MQPDMFFEDMDMMGGAAAATAATAGIGLLVGIFLVMMLAVLALSVGVYVVQSLSLHTIAKRRGIHKSWLAWLPVGNMWILGSIADQYQYVAKGKVRNRRKTLLGLTIATFVATIPMEIVQLVTVYSIVPNSGEGAVGYFILTAVLGLITAAISITAVVFQYIAYYELFSSCQPSNSVLYIVLSIVFSITLPIFLLICRNKDEGMPPRKQPRPESAPQLPVVEEAPDEDAVTDEDFEPEA